MDKSIAYLSAAFQPGSVLAAWAASLQAEEAGIGAEAAVERDGREFVPVAGLESCLVEFDDPCPQGGRATCEAHPQGEWPEAPPCAKQEQPARQRTIRAPGAYPHAVAVAALGGRVIAVVLPVALRGERPFAQKNFARILHEQRESRPD